MGTSTVIAALTGACVVGLACGSGSPDAALPIEAPPRTIAAAPAYVGTPRCAACHPDQAKAHTGSDHDRAMEAPSVSTVEAPFDDRVFEHDGVETRFHVEGDRYLVHTEGPDGQAHDYTVAWTFGVDPLQQYLLDLGGGRLQTLTVAWDTRPGEAGGQRYYSLYPDEHIPPGDPLHWTGAMQNWNYACADCHSTAYRKGYARETDSFAPSWVEPDVGCEACHGPGADHVRWAEAGADPQARGPRAGLLVKLDSRRAWTISSETHNALPQPELEHIEVETCAACHARRHQLAEARRPDQPLLDFYRPELLDAPLYHADGQIDGEVYVYGSFIQSRMFHAGVRCSDCHDPHSLELRAEGDELCARCHDRASYAQPSHHHHAPGGAGSACVDCHMPNKIFMGVDPRRDHSLRRPRPQLSARLAVPNPCSGCHGDRDAEWIAARSTAWWGDDSDSTRYAETLAAGRRGDPAAFEGLVTLAGDDTRPAIVRATAVGLLEGYGPQARAAITAAASDRQALVRLGAIYAARGLELGSRFAALAGLLDDPLRAIRIEAARVLAPVPIDLVPDDIAAKLRAAQDELLASERLHADRSDAWVRIGIFELERGRPEAAEAALQTALEVEPNAIAPRINLADLARARADEAGARRWLEDALARAPDDPEALHALGLLEIRADQHERALVLLGRAATLRPDNPRYAYVHVVALWELERRADASTALEQALARHPFEHALLELRRALIVE